MSDKLERLQAKKAELEAKIRQERSAQTRAKRREANHRKVLAGAMLLEAVNRGMVKEADLLRMMDSFLVMPAGKEPTPNAIRAKNRERSLFGLDPIE